MSQKFTIRVRRGLLDLAAVYREYTRHRVGLSDKDAVAALAWIDQQCAGADGATGHQQGDGMPKVPPAWAKQQFGGGKS